MSVKKDLFLNFFASAIPIVILQIFIFPILNQASGVAEYGKIIAIWSALNAVPVMVGNSICNSRQLLEGRYINRGFKGDFPPMALFFTAVVSVMAVVGSMLLGADSSEVIGIGLLSLLMSLYNYGIVFYRLAMDFKGILLANMALSFGYAFGLSVYFCTGYWIAILLFGHFFALAYVLFTTSWRSEKLAITPLAKSAFATTATLMVALVLAGVANYGDRLILLPLAGSEALSIYYIASLVGKLIVLVLSPSATVILSYLTHTTNLIDIPLGFIMKIAAAVGVLFWAISCLASGPILDALYPLQAYQAKLYVPISTAASILIALCSLLNPLALRFRDSKWQIFINSGYLIILVSAASFFASWYGLMGYCVGVTLASSIKLLVILILVLKGKDSEDYCAIAEEDKKPADDTR